MGRTAKLSYTSNPKLKEYIGLRGELSRNNNGGYDFRMYDNGLNISTTAAKQNTVLGDIDYPVCRNIGFETRSGTVYQFDFLDIEKLSDGVRKDGNRFVGFEGSYQIGNWVYNNDGVKGEVLEANYEKSMYFLKLESGGLCWYHSSQLKAFDESLENKMQNADLRSAETNRGIEGPSLCNELEY